MTRFVSSNNASESDKRSIVMVTLVDLDFASGHVRAHDGTGTLSFGGNSYLGVGQYGGIEGVVETLDVIARPLKLTLSGIPADLVPNVTTEVYQGRQVTVYLGFIDQTTMAFVDTPESVWNGIMDKLDVMLDEGSATIKLNCENDLYIEPLAARYTDQDQQLRYSGDTFFNCLYMIPAARSTWGSSVQSYSDASGGGGGAGGGRGFAPIPEP